MVQLDAYRAFSNPAERIEQEFLHEPVLLAVCEIYHRPRVRIQEETPEYAQCEVYPYEH